MQRYPRPIREIVCKGCNEMFTTKARTQKFCSKACANKVTSENNKTGKYSTCQTCKTKIYNPNWAIGKKYCSRQCAIEGSYVRRLEITCSAKDCNNVILKTKREIQRRKSERFYCCQKCQAIDNPGLKKIQSMAPQVKCTRPELAFCKLLDDAGIKYKHQYSIQWKNGWKKWYDFYILDYNMLIEIDGTYWHGKGLQDDELNDQQMQTRNNDRLKNILANDNGYKLVRIWDDELPINIKEFLHEQTTN